MKIILTFILPLLCFKAHSAPAPEDGSAIPRAVFWSPPAPGQPWNGGDAHALATLLNERGIPFFSLENEYEWLQDVLLFDREGAVWELADLPADEEIAVGLTLGVFFDGRLTRLAAHWAGQFQLPSIKKNWLFVEGGELISGTKKNGEPYVLVDADVVDRAERWGKSIGVHRSRGAWEDQLAAELGVERNNVRYLRAPGHLDIYMTALPGGAIMVHDDRLVEESLVWALANAEGQEQRLLYETLGLWRNGRPLPWGSGRIPVHYPETNLVLDRVAADIESLVPVLRVAGRFSLGNDSGTNVEDSVNFFNGFWLPGGLSKEPAFVTNRGPRSLERRFAEFLNKIGLDEVYFPGDYRRGAGINCAVSLQPL